MTKANASLLAFAILGTIACGRGERLDPATDKLGRATGPVEPISARRADIPSGPRKSHKGKVLETIEVARYTYLRIETAPGSELWAAVSKPDAKIETGSPVEVIESTVMTDFRSPALNRVFPSVVFGVLSDQPQAAAEAGTDSPK